MDISKKKRKFIKVSENKEHMILYLDLLCQTLNDIDVFNLFTVKSHNCNIRFVINAEYFTSCEIQTYNFV